MSDLLTDIFSPKPVSFKVGLYFGSYNPVHIGHMVIANYMVEFTNIDQLWFVVSPQNPHKAQENLLDDYHRLELVNRAIDGDPRFRTSNIEFGLPKPSYTIDTLAYLHEKFPNHQFSIIMGSDNLESFHKWKNHQVILENYGIIVYPRPGFDKSKVIQHPNINIAANTPLMEISSSFIRESIKSGKDVRYFMPKKSWEYLDEMNFYKR
ncbi:MAG: nicotinate (nicotinamide) nucleotide adenylyltransferase [Draconibacterium sp.]